MEGLSGRLKQQSLSISHSQNRKSPPPLSRCLRLPSGLLAQDLHRDFQLLVLRRRCSSAQARPGDSVWASPARPWLPSRLCSCFALVSMVCCPHCPCLASCHRRCAAPRGRHSPVAGSWHLRDGDARGCCHDVPTEPAWPRSLRRCRPWALAARGRYQSDCERALGL